MNQTSSKNQTTAETDQTLWVELSDDELSNVSGGSGSNVNDKLNDTLGGNPPPIGTANE
jgi:bacteriocin-like protein